MLTSLLCDTQKCAKAIGWRAIASLDTFMIVYIIDKSVDTASKVAVIEVVSKFILYYLYEHATEYISNNYCAKEKTEDDDMITPDATTENIPEILP